MVIPHTQGWSYLGVRGILKIENSCYTMINNHYVSQSHTRLFVRFHSCSVFNWRAQVGRDAVGLREMLVCFKALLGCWNRREYRAQQDALYHSNKSSPLLLCSFSQFCLRVCVWTRCSLLLYFCFSVFLSTCPSSSSWSLQDSGSGLETWALWQCWLRRVLRSTAVAWRTLRSRVWRL